MTFRVRLIVATALAVALAVVAACLASYWSSHDALQGSVDSSLYSAAAGPGGDAGIGEEVAGVFHQIVTADGTAYPTSDLPVDSVVMRAANDLGGEILRTVTVGRSTYRELIVPLEAGTLLECPSGPCELQTDAASIFSVNISGQQHELNVLALRLWLLALCGVLLATALGYLAAQAALRPLESVTNEIETVAETRDVSYRMEEGTNDELGRLRRVFNRLLSSVEQSQQTQRQLVLDSSHELRTPLTSLRTNAQVLSRADELTGDELRQLSADMVAQTDELAALISDLTELARAEGIDGHVELVRFDELVDECVDTARTHARTRDIEITVEVEPCEVRGQRDRLARAVTNLLTNAIKFARPGGRVRVRLRPGVLTVEDDGPGVASEDVPFIFERFWRSPSARSLPGSGLGLSITSQVARDHGGSVSVGRSHELGGAQFTLELPLADEPPAES